MKSSQAWDEHRTSNGWGETPSSPDFSPFEVRVRCWLFELPVSGCRRRDARGKNRA